MASPTSLWQQWKREARPGGKCPGPGPRWVCAVPTSCPVPEDHTPALPDVYSETCIEEHGFRSLRAGFCCFQGSAARQENLLVPLQLCIKLPFTHQSELITPLKYEKVYRLPPEFSLFISVLTFTKENKLQLWNYIFKISFVVSFPSLRSLFTSFLIGLDHWVCFIQLYNLYHVETGLSFRYPTKQLTTF